jgi:hypothetical protein
VITSQPASLTAAAGNTAIFSVSAESICQVSYQWQKNGQNLTDSDRVSGSQTPRLSIMDADDPDAGTYTVVVANQYGQVTSQGATLALNDAALLGRWHFNDPGAWSGEQGQTPLSSTGVQSAPSWSGTAALVDSYIPATLRYRAVEASGAANLFYKRGTARLWVRPDWTSGVGPGTEAPLLEEGLKDSAYGWWGLTISADGTQIRFTTQSSSASTLNLSASINWHAGDWHQVVLTWSAASSQLYIDGQAVVANGLGVANYPGPGTRAATGLGVGSDLSGWYQVRCALDELETRNYVLSASAVAADYQGVLSTASPFVLDQPWNQCVALSDNATFSVTAGGTAPLRYQWTKNGVNIPGATSSSYTRSNVQAADAGTYAVVVSNSYGSAISSNAVLSLSPFPLAWLLQYFGPGYASNPNALPGSDADGDGWTNLQEYQNGTNPNQADQPLQVRIVRPNANTVLP